MWEESWNSELVLSLSEVTVGPVLGAGCCARDVPSGQDGLRGAGCMSRKRWGSAVLCVSLLWYCLRLLGIEPHAPVPCMCPAGTVRTAGLSPAARCDVVGAPLVGDGYPGDQRACIPWLVGFGCAVRSAGVQK